MSEPVSLRSLRWTARVFSILYVGTFLIFAFGGGVSLSAFTGRELLLFLFFPLGVCFGTALGWWREGLGGGIALGSVVAFYLAHYLLSQRFPRGFALLLLALPGFLFLVCWLWTRARGRQEGV